MSRLKPLSDRVLDVLPSFEAAPLARDVAAMLAMDEPAIKAAFEELDEAGRAHIVRRGNGLHLVPADHPERICVICKREFAPVRKETVTCSHSCARHLAWQNEDMRRRHRESIKASHSDPERRRAMSIHSKKYASRPDVRKRTSERNKQDWSDPVKRMKRVIAIEAAWKDGAPGVEKRKAVARRRKQEFWRDPESRQAAIEAMRTGKRGRHQRATMALLDQHPDISEEEIAERTGRTLKQVKTLMRRLYKLGKIDRQPVDGRKRKQSQAEIDHRTRLTRELRAKRKAAA